MPTMMLVNRRTGERIASAVEIAETRRARRRGLLGRDGLDRSAALVLTPCNSIHTAFMRFAIDVLFVDRSGRVRRIVHGLPPWRIAWCVRARGVVELAAGTLRPGGLLVGDSVYLAPALETEPAVRDAALPSRPGSLHMTADNSAWLGS